MTECLEVNDSNKKQGWVRRERRRKRDIPNPVKCSNENILSAFYKTFITLTIQQESVNIKFILELFFLKFMV